jgi:CRISPR/Cas system CSM-associated protein Csm2 small subunit
MSELYIPKSEILILRTLHLEELREHGNGVEKKRIFDWLSDETLEIIVNTFISKMSTKDEKYIISCTYNGSAYYILGTLRKFYGKIAFTVITTLKSEGLSKPFSTIEDSKRFNFETDLNSFLTVFNKEEHDARIEQVIKEARRKKLEKLDGEQRRKYFLERLKRRVEKRVKKEKEAKIKEAKIKALYSNIVTVGQKPRSHHTTSKRLRVYKFGAKNKYKESGQYED